MNKKFFKAKITENRTLNSQFCILTVAPLSPNTLPQPGQFYMLQVGGTYDPLLKRPFSIFKFGEEYLQFLYRVKGKGTQLLSTLKKDEGIELIGPLGNSYPAPQGDFIAVAGGVGIASIFPLLESARGKGYAFYGARHKGELILTDLLKEAAKELFITTEDASEGIQGLVTECCKNFLCEKEALCSGLPIYACGPNPMIKSLKNAIGERKPACYVSLEENMACGVGACLGCVVNTTSGYKRVCKEGTIFKLEDIAW